MGKGCRRVHLLDEALTRERTDQERSHGILSSKNRDCKTVQDTLTWCVTFYKPGMVAHAWEAEASWRLASSMY